MAFGVIMNANNKASKEPDMLTCNGNQSFNMAMICTTITHTGRTYNIIMRHTEKLCMLYFSDINICIA